MSVVDIAQIYIRKVDYENVRDAVYDLVGKKVHMVYLIVKRNATSNEMLILSDLIKRINIQCHILEFDEHQPPHETLEQAYYKIKRTINTYFRENSNSKVSITIDMTDADPYTFMIMLYIHLIFKDISKLVVRAEHNYIYLPPIESTLKPQKLAILKLLSEKENNEATYHEIRKELVSMFHDRKYSISSISKHVSKLESYGFVKTYGTLIKRKNKQGNTKNVRIMKVALTESGRMALFVAEKISNKGLENK